jgi:TolB-like protein
MAGTDAAAPPTLPVVPRRRPARIAALWLLAAAGAALADPRTAEAQSRRRAAVVRFAFGERVPEASRELLASKLFEGLAAHDFQAFAGPVVSQMLRREAGLEACADEGCYRRIAERLDVEYLVAGAVRTERRNYEIDLELISGRSGRVLGKKSDRCELCGLKEVGDKLAGLVGALAPSAVPDEAPRGRLRVEARPAGARVAIDGRDRGPAPVTVEVGEGEHRVSVSAAGYHPEERRLLAESGARETLSVTLAPLGRDAPPPAAASGPWRKLGWVGLAAGAAALVAGAVFMLEDGKHIGCYVEDEAGNCTRAQANDFKLQAGLGLGAGAALAAAGGLVLYFSRPAAASAPAGHAARGVVVGATGRF